VDVVQVHYVKASVLLEVVFDNRFVTQEMKAIMVVKHEVLPPGLAEKSC
jgi:hypothetical protein